MYVHSKTLCEYGIVHLGRSYANILASVVYRFTVGDCTCFVVCQILCGKLVGLEWDLVQLWQRAVCRFAAAD